MAGCDYVAHTDFYCRFDSGRSTEMKLYAFDVETHLVRPGLTAPKLVCVSIAHETEPVRLLDAADGLAWFRGGP